MILQRLASAIRHQSWSQIITEILIVVIGIFLGLQVTGWNEARQLQNEEYSTLIRLQAESVTVVEYWQQQVYSSEQDNTNRKLFLEILETGTMPSEQRDAFEDAILRIAHYPTNSPPSSVYDEMISSGGLRLISDDKARSAVSEYSESFEFINGQLTQFRAILPVLSRAYEGKIISVYAPDKPSLRRFEYDLRLLSENQQFKSSMVDGVRDQIQFHNYRVWTLEAALEMCNEVSRAVSMSCDVEEIDLSKIAEMDGVNQ